jgi:hypothetical protein
MDYTWNLIDEQGQPPIGFIEMYESPTDGRAKILAIINYFPQLPDSNYEKEATITLFYEGAKETITDGYFHWILNDLSEMITINEDKRYPQKTSKKIEYSQIQFYIVEKLPQLKYYTHGDYAIIDNFKENKKNET